MDVETQLKMIITDDDMLQKVLKVIGNGNVSMQKYRQTEKYKLAQAKAAAKFKAGKKAKIDESATYIARQLDQVAADKREELSSSDEDIDVLPKVIMSMTELWHNYNATTESHGGPTMTRSAYCKLFPQEYERCDSYKDALGRKHYNVDSAVIVV